MTDEEQTPDTSQETKTVASEVSTPGVHTADEVSTGESKKTRGSIRPPAELYDEFIALKRGDESANDLLRRLIDASTDVDTLQGSIDDLVSSNEHLMKVNTEIRETLEIEQHQHQTQFDDHVYEIGQLQARITTLENAAETAVVPAGEQAAMDSIGIKDVIDEARDMCGDDETCNKVIGKMIDLKAHFASKAVDHEHTAEQSRLDREQKELDRKSKEDLAEKDRKFKAEQAEKDQKNKIELALAKKGGFKSEFLEDVVFLGGGSPKRPGKEIERRKQQARHAAEDEEEYFDAGAEEELRTPEDFDPDADEELLMPEGK